MIISERSPLGLDGWLEFNRLRWGVTPERRRFGGQAADEPSLDVVLYRNRAKRLYLPLGNPYLALRCGSAALLPSRLNRQWLDLAADLADEMGRTGLANALPFPPGVVDLRPWRWAGFSVSVKYTFYLDLPFGPQETDPAVRRRLRKVAKEGYACERTDDLSLVYQCLLETEAHKGFRHRLSLQQLELARELLGEEQFRPYLCRTPSGEPVSACIMLHMPGARAIYWVGGALMAQRQHGTFPLLMTHVAGDLEAAGATGIDLAGANIPSVATAKANLGARLVPYYTVESFGMKPLAKWLRSWWRFPRPINTGVAKGE